MHIYPITRKINIEEHSPRAYYIAYNTRTLQLSELVFVKIMGKYYWVLQGDVTLTELSFYAFIKI